MRRVLLWGGLGILLMVGLLGFTEAGLVALLRLANHWSPVELSARAQGSLFGGPVLWDVELDSAGFLLRADRLSMDWQPLALVSAGTLRVEHLHCRGLNIVVLGGDARSDDAFSPELFLPIPVELHKLSVEQLSIAMADADPLTLDRMNLEARSDGQTLRFAGQLEAANAWLDVTGNLMLSGNLALDSQLRWRSSLGGLAMSGEGPLGGDTQRGWQTRQSLGGAIPGRLAGRLQMSPQVAWSLDGQLRPDPTLLGGEAPLQDLSLDLEAQGEAGTVDIQGAASALAAELGPVDGEFHLRRQGPSWRLEKLMVASADTPLSVIASGNFDPQGREVEATGRWDSLAWPLDAPTMGSPQGEFQVTGTPGNFQFRLHSEWWHESLGQGQLLASGHGDQHVIELRDLRLSRPGEEVALLTGAGSFRYDDGHFQLDGRWEGVQWPLEAGSPLLQGGPGRLGLSGYW